MGKILYLECNSGISGDMTVGALLDLGADKEVLTKALDSLGVGGYRLHFGRTVKCGLDAYDFNVHLEEGEGHDHGHHHGHSHENQHAHEHENAHERSHEHNHAHDYKHDHDHDHHHKHDHDHDHHHKHDHDHEHHHEHDHDHEHHHEHDHDHEYHHKHEHGHKHNHDHIHRNIHDIYAIIERLDTNTRVKEMAKRMFDIVAEAESKAHGIPVEEIHFHEVGAIDSIVDIIGVAVCVDNLGIEEIAVSPLAEGFGSVRCQHGVIPVPVPATANISSAHGLELRFTDNMGEMVTPTGAAIAAALKTREGLPASCRILKTGLGAGKKDFKQANVLRAMILEDTSHKVNLPVGQREVPLRGEEPLEKPGEQMWVLEANIDDSSGEALGLVMESLLEAGAADVWYTPIYMKKNRPAYMLSLICREEEINGLEDIVFTQATTIGVRRHPVSRTILNREKRTISTELGEAEVKICTHGERVFFYPEYESIRNICRQKALDYQTVYCKIREEAERLWTNN